MENKYYKEFNADLILRDVLAIDRTILANERTLLSYLRTSLTFGLAGLTLVNLFQTSLSYISAIIFFTVSILCLIIGIRRFFLVKKDLKSIHEK